MSNPNSKVTLRSSPKRKRSRVDEFLDVGSLTPFGFTDTMKLKVENFEHVFVKKCKKSHEGDLELKGL